MTEIPFVQAAMSAPNPQSVTHPSGGQVVYTCHMAVMHWMCMALGDAAAEANRVVSAFTKASCPGCNGGGNHNSVDASEYGGIFCKGATKIPNMAGVAGAVTVGDVLITSFPNRPMHSMVVVGKDATTVQIRAFNNMGTFGAGPRLQYDTTSRNICDPALWFSNAAKFGATGSDLYVVPHRSFATAMRTVRTMLARGRVGT